MALRLARSVGFASLAFALHCGSSGAPATSNAAPSAPSDATSATSGAPSNGDGPSSGAPGESLNGDDAGSSTNDDASAPTPIGASMPLPKTFSKQMLDLTTYPNAVCNDGSAAGYYAEAGASADSPWILLLEGGSWCSSNTDCAGRDASLSSSKGWSATISPSGILSNSATDNPHFATANRIDVPYCTSDVFSGNAPPIGGTTNFSFRGVTVFQAVIADLKARYGLGAKGQHVLLAGVSAGGVSVLVNADRLAADLPGANVSALVDAGFLPDVAPLTGPSIYDQFQTAIANWKGMPDASCLAKNATTPARCYLAEYVWPTLTTPIFFGQSLEDPHGPLHAGGFTLTATPTAAQKNWLNDVYTPAMITRLDATAPAAGAFSPCEVIHTMADNTAWTTLAIGADHYDDLVFTWFGGGSGARAIDTPCSLK